MLRDCISDNFTSVSYGVKFNLLASLHELRHHNRVFLRHFCSKTKEIAKLLVIVAYIHRRT